MKERPILMSAPMVRALLAGTKGQTRRIVTHEWEHGFHHRRPFNRATGRDDFTTFSEPYSGITRAPVWFYSWGNSRWLRCPYGQPGDRLYVKESWCHKIDDRARVVYNGEGNLDNSCVWYEATNPEVIALDGDGWQRFNKDGRESSPWQSPLFMPRWASRITLEITGVRVERLQDISEEDAKAEGVIREDLPRDPDNFHPPGSYGYVPGTVPFPQGRIHVTAKEAYQDLWETINGAALHPGDKFRSESGRRYKVKRIQMHLGIRQAIAMQLEIAP